MTKDSSTDLFAVSLFLLHLYIHCLRLVSHTCSQNWRPSPAKSRTVTKINNARPGLSRHAQRVAVDYAQSTSCSSGHVRFGSRRPPNYTGQDQVHICSDSRVWKWGAAYRSLNGTAVSRKGKYRSKDPRQDWRVLLCLAS